MLTRFNTDIRIFLVTLASIGLTSCMVGPDFKPPSPPSTSSYTSSTPSPLPHKTASAPALGKSGKAQHFIYGGDIPGEWWRLFHSPEINELIQVGFKNSPSVIAVKARQLEARENVTIQTAPLFPAMSAQFSPSRQPFSNETAGVTEPPSIIFNLFNTSVNVGYTLDVFGGQRRQLEIAKAQRLDEQYDIKAAKTTLAGNIATTAITIASLRAQIKETRDLIQSQQNLLDHLKTQYRLGGSTQLDVESQQYKLEQTRATLPPLQQNLEKNYHALAVLIGELPSETHLPLFNLDKLILPTDVPISIPSRLLKQRPDIQSAEATLHTACAQIGVSTANLYPTFNLTAMYGWASLTLGQQFNNVTNYWLYGGTVSESLFQGGALTAQKRLDTYAYYDALSSYRLTVLQAFQQVADALRALQNDAQQLKEQNRAEIAAKRTLDMTLRQFRLGGTSFVSLLIAQQIYQQARLNRITIQAARYTDTAALFVALGGGWWNEGPFWDKTEDLVNDLHQYSPPP